MIRLHMTFYSVIKAYHIVTYKNWKDAIKISYSLFILFKKPKILRCENYFPPGRVISLCLENREGISMSELESAIGVFLCGFRSFIRLFYTAGVPP